MIDALRRILAAQVAEVALVHRRPIETTLDELWLAVEASPARIVAADFASGVVPVSYPAWKSIAEAVALDPDERSDGDIAHAVRDLAAMNEAQAGVIGKYRELLADSPNPLETLRNTIDDNRHLDKLVADLRDAVLGGKEGDLVIAAWDLQRQVESDAAKLEERGSILQEIRRQFALEVDDPRDELATAQLVALEIKGRAEAEALYKEAHAAAAGAALDLSRAERDRDDLRAALDAVRAALPDGDSVEDLADTVRSLVDVALQTSAEALAIAPGPAEPPALRPAVLPYEDKPAVLHSNPPVPDDFPGRDKPAPRVPMAELLKEASTTHRISPAQAEREPLTLTVDQKVAMIARLANGEDRKGVAKALGLPDGRYVAGVASRYKFDVEKLKLAAPEDRLRILEAVRTKIESAKAVAA